MELTICLHLEYPDIFIPRVLAWSVVNGNSVDVPLVLVDPVDVLGGCLGGGQEVLGTSLYIVCHVKETSDSG